MELWISTDENETNIIKLVSAITWSGENGRCGRTLAFSVLSSPTDESVPVADIPLGAGVRLSIDDGTYFDGYVFTRQKLTESSTIEITCYDRGIYLKRNELTRNYSNSAAEDVTVQLCGEFGVEVGSIAKTNVRLSRNFVGTSIYRIIQTMYTLASRETGEAYQIRFNGAALDVVVKAVSEETLVIKGGSNLIDAAVTESVEQMITQVAIYGEDDNLVGVVKSEERTKLYGQMQKYIKQVKDEDPKKAAQKLLDDNGINQKITVNNLGNLECVTGNAVVIEEPYTGLYGLFWIDADTHTWKNGLYFNRLVLNFRRMMDEQEAGSLPTAKSTGKTGSGNQNYWEYLYTPGG